MKHTSFFCDNCGKPVPLDAAECPHCGSRFTAVQCPQCAFVGKAELFSEGCPECGYLAPAVGESPLTFDSNVPAVPPAANRPATQDEDLKPLPAYRKSQSRLPGWFYTLTSILLLAVLVVLMIIIFSLH